MLTPLVITNARPTEAVKSTTLAPDDRDQQVAFASQPNMEVIATEPHQNVQTAMKKLISTAPATPPPKVDIALLNSTHLNKIKL